MTEGALHHTPPAEPLLLSPHTLGAFAQLPHSDPFLRDPQVQISLQQVASNISRVAQIPSPI